MSEASKLPVPDRRPLTDSERELVRFLLEHGTKDAAAYAQQLPDVMVVSRCGCGCPTINLAVGGRAAAPSSPSTTLADAQGRSPEGDSCGIILHERDGLISELEIYSFGDAGQFSLPRIEDISFE